ncbi:MAG: sensor histidine kinase [Acidimicrobiales bacterium]
MPPPRERPRRHLGLRARLTAAFAVSALILSVILALITYALTRSSVLRSEETSARRQTFVNASLLRGDLPSTRATDVPQLLTSLGTAASSASVLHYRGHWYASSLVVGKNGLPATLRDQVVAHRSAAEQHFVLNSHPELAVGVPLAAVQGAYFEVFDLQSLNHTLSVLALSLAAAAAATTALGAAAGRSVSRRALMPLAETARVAAQISEGRLETRLEAGGDVDLAGLASSFNAMVDALQLRIQRDARFASDVAHELRSPLTTLSTTLGVLEARREELSARSQQALDLLGAEVRQFERLVQDLLEISRYDAGIVESERDLEPVRLDELVGHAMAQERSTGVPLVVEPGATDLRVQGDKRRLERVVANLLGNARSHGGGAVEVRVQRLGDRARLIVDDAGPGVPPEDRTRVFERFSRGPLARRRLGTDGVGLGLALVAEHVTLHRGTVWVEERPGGGARFVVELPASRESEPAAGTYPASALSPP